jgi:outer membrane protein assembly factor BamB
MYGHDVARSQVTAEQLRTPLEPCWAFKPLFPPQAAWGDPKTGPVENVLELRRVHFDDVFQVAAAEDAVYFGSSADNKVYCLDASSGKVRWTMITGGPVRLAPTVVNGRVYVGSDDGYAYCLNAEDGAVIWRFHAAPEDRHALGHGKMISLWPLRSGILVDDGIAYFAAGLFPAEGVFLYAVDATTGREIWRNDTCGEAPQSLISLQGYLLASKSAIYAPMARVSPAAFDRQTGKLLTTTYFGKSVGGTYALLAGDEMFTGTEEMVGYRAPRDVFAAFVGRKLVVVGDTAYVATDSELSALDRKRFPAASREVRNVRSRIDDVKQTLRSSRKFRNGTPAERDQYAELEKRAAALAIDLAKAEAAFANTVRWKTPCDCQESLILAGDTLFAGGKEQVVAIAADSGKVLWTGKVEGVAKGLAAAAGRLLVSTDKGLIYSFGPAGSPQHGLVSPSTTPEPFASSPQNALFTKAAQDILRQTNVTRGYCLVLGLETGQLALELARRSELMVYAVSPDAEKVAAARKAIDAAGCYGGRVCAEQWPLEQLPYADYFANLVVSETTVAGGQSPNLAEMMRMLKPCGGVLALRPNDGAAVEPLPEEPSQVSQRLRGENAWPILVRGSLRGAGNWTHLYGNAGNTACGDDQRFQCPMTVLWFGHPGPGNMVSRHLRAAGPLVVDGRMFVQGENLVMAYDAYNGLRLWQREIPGAMRVNASHDGGNLAANHEGLFVAIGNKCLRLDPATGETLRTYPLPPASDGKPRRWGYIACNGKILLGSEGLWPILSQRLFALDIESGKPLWTYEGKSFANNSVSLGDGRVCLLDTKVTPEQRNQAIDAQRKRIHELPEVERAKAEAALEKADIRLMLALDLKTGKTVWQQPIDLTDCGGSGGGVATMYGDGVLIIFGVYLDGHYWQQFFAGQFATRRVIALAGQDGKWLWSQPVGYRVRPLIIGNTLHAEPWAFDLHTGAPRMRVHPVTGESDRWQFARPGHHCGLPIASPNALFFRSMCFGYYDLVGDCGTMHFGAQRPGCWINFIPAAGLLLMPEASAGCMCPFPNMCSVAFQPAAKNKAYAYYSAPGPMTPVQHLALNFGAAGDRKDRSDLWLGFPRPTGSLVLQFPVETSFYPGGSFVHRNSNYTAIANTESPWLFASGAYGLKKCVIPLLGKADGTAKYDVTLALADPENDQPGQRVFDVKLQGQLVREHLDIVKEAGGRDRALMVQFRGILVSDKLTIELIAKSPTPERRSLPILQGVKVSRGEIVSLGCAAPDLTLSDVEPKQSGALELTNLSVDFTGTLQVGVPAGFRVEPGRVDIKLTQGKRSAIRLEVGVDKNVPAGKYPLGIKLLRADGTVELERGATIEHLGRRGRVVLSAVEDLSLQQRYPDLNKGSASVLLVDGGNATIGDVDHSMTLVRFRLDIPGRPIGVRFRITNADNPSGAGGRICLVQEPWSETKTTYVTRPKLGDELGRLGKVSERQTVEVPLQIDLNGKTELSLAIDPTNCDGVDYLSRESGSPPQLIIDYEPRE